MNLGSILEKFKHSSLELEESIHHTLKELVLFSEQIPLPASGDTLKRWQILAEVSATNLSLGKLFESHLDALAILHELHIPADSGRLWAIWAAEGGPQPLQLEQGKLSGSKPWCSAAAWVDSALVTCRNEHHQSQLLILDMLQPGIHYHQQHWHAVGMQHTGTSRLELDQVAVQAVAAPHAYLERAGFWHGAAGVAACWYGATIAVAQYLKQGVLNRPHLYTAMYLGEVSSELLATRAMFHQVAQQIDQYPEQSHELKVRSLRAQVEASALHVLNTVGKALGATPFCENAHFARLVADLPVFIRQSHAAFDLERIGELSAQEEQTLWQL